MIFENGTGMVEVLPTNCRNQVTKPDCISCCTQTNTCNIVYIAYNQNSHQIDWCTLYHTEEVELISAAYTASVPEYWVQMWSQNGGQPAMSQLAVFGKNHCFQSSVVLVLYIFKISLGPGTRG